MGKRLGFKRCFVLAICVACFCLSTNEGTISEHNLDFDTKAIKSSYDNFECEKLTSPCIPVEKPHKESLTSVCSDEEIELLSHIAMAEAEGEDHEGKMLVMLVVLNRVKSNKFPNTVSEVIYQKYQFSCILDGRYDISTPNEECIELAQSVAFGQYKDISNGALYFSSEINEQTWHSTNLEYLFTHGNHKFYK